MVAFFTDKRGPLSCDLKLFSTYKKTSDGYTNPPHKSWKGPREVVEFPVFPVRTHNADAVHDPVDETNADKTQTTKNYSHTVIEDYSETKKNVGLPLQTTLTKKALLLPRK